jgi:hypothetical protein
METVFIYCGTYTLEQSLQPVKDFSKMQIGDVFVKGGAPGHAEIVVDMAVNKTTGKKIYLLAEGLYACAGYTYSFKSGKYRAWPMA